MIIVENKTKFNSYSIQELTMGKLLAIHDALKTTHRGPVGEDVFIILHRFLESHGEVLL